VQELRLTQAYLGDEGELKQLADGSAACAAQLGSLAQLQRLALLNNFDTGVSTLQQLAVFAPHTRQLTSLQLSNQKVLDSAHVVELAACLRCCRHFVPWRRVKHTTSRCACFARSSAGAKFKLLLWSLVGPTSEPHRHGLTMAPCPQVIDKDLGLCDSSSPEVRPSQRDEELFAPLRQQLASLAHLERPRLRGRPHSDLLSTWCCHIEG